MKVVLKNEGSLTRTIISQLYKESERTGKSFASSRLQTTHNTRRRKHRSFKMTSSPKQRILAPLCINIPLTAAYKPWAYIYNIVRGFGWICNWGSLYPEELKGGIKNSFGNKLTHL